MKSVKWALFNLHFWSASLDLSISLLAQPFMCTPAFAGFSLGIWGLIGVPTVVWSLGIIAVFKSEFFMRVVAFQVKRKGDLGLYEEFSEQGVSHGRRGKSPCQNTA